MAEFPIVGVEAVVLGIDKFTADMKKMSGGIDAVGNSAQGIGKYVAGLAQGFLGLAQVIIGAATGAIPLIINGLIDIGKGLLKGLEGIGQFIQGVVHLAAAIGGTLFNAIKSFMGLVLSPFISLWKSLVDIVKTALGVFAGISLSNIIKGIGNHIKGLVSEAVEAADAFQKLQIRLEGLLAIQNVRGSIVGPETTTRIVELSAAQRLSVMQLNTALRQQTNELSDLAAAHQRVAEKEGEGSVAALQLQARMDELSQKIGGTNIELERLEALRFVQVLGDASAPTLSFADALAQAVPQARALFEWMAEFSILTPFDVSDIANTFTLATSYGFAADQAKTLTVAVSDFASGMGLSGEATELIIQNLGQMVQAGKITGTELRDLARGSFVPVNDILALTAKNLGYTIDQFNALRKAGKIPALPFIEAFIEFASTNFAGASARQARTLAGVTSNIRELTSVLVGMKIIKPALDIVTGSVADFIAALFPIESRGNQPIFKLFDSLGVSLSTVVATIMGGFPSATELAATFMEALAKIDTSMQHLVDGDWQASLSSLGIPQWVIDTVQNLLNGFTNIWKFWQEHGAEIKQAIFDNLGAIWEIIFPGGNNPFTDLSQGFEDFTKNLKASDVITTINNIGSAIQSAVGWLTGNAPAIKVQGPQPGGEGAGKIPEFKGLPQIIEDIKTKFSEWWTIATSVATVIKGIFDTFVLIKDAIGNLINAFNVGMNPIGSIIGEAIMGGLKAALVAQTPAVAALAALAIGGVVNAFTVGKTLVATQIAAIVTVITTAAGTIASKLGSAGGEAINGFVTGFVTAWAKRKTTLEKVIQEIVDFVKKLLGIKSPSKVFAKIGNQVMQGMALGMKQGSPMVNAAFGSIPMPGMGSIPFSGGSTSNNTTNYNVNMQSQNNFATQSAPTDDLTAVLAILRSL